MTTRRAGWGKAPTTDDPVLAEMVRQEAGPDSDYDLMVVVPDDTPPEQQRSSAGYRAVRDLGAARDIFVSTASNFRRQLHLKASFPSTAAREGIVVYGA